MKTAKTFLPFVKDGTTIPAGSKVTNMTSSGPCDDVHFLAVEEICRLLPVGHALRGVWLNCGVNIPDAYCEPYPSTLLDDISYLIRSLKFLRSVMSKSQFYAFGDLCKNSEERDFFRLKALELEKTFKDLPALYLTDGQKDSLFTVHYFGPSFDCWIKEIDLETGEAFGMSKFYGNDPELGYISIHDLCENGMEIDLNFAPCIKDEL